MSIFGCPNLVREIISNGTLFNRRGWEGYPTIYNKIWSLRISFDAASKAILEKLRRPANQAEKSQGQRVRVVSRTLLLDHQPLPGRKLENEVATVGHEAILRLALLLKLLPAVIVKHNVSAAYDAVE